MIVTASSSLPMGHIQLCFSFIQYHINHGSIFLGWWMHSKPLDVPYLWCSWEVRHRDKVLSTMAKSFVMGCAMVKGVMQHLLYVAQNISDWNESVWRNRSAAKMKRWSFFTHCMCNMYVLFCSRAITNRVVVLLLFFVLCFILLC